MQCVASTVGCSRISAAAGPGQVLSKLIACFADCLFFGQIGRSCDGQHSAWVDHAGPRGPGCSSGKPISSKILHDCLSCFFLHAASRTQRRRTRRFPHGRGLGAVGQVASVRPGLTAGTGVLQDARAFPFSWAATTTSRSRIRRAFDPNAAGGKRLDIAAGTGVRHEPGQSREVGLVLFGAGGRWLQAAGDGCAGVTGWLQSAGGDPGSTGRCVHVT